MGLDYDTSGNDPGIVKDYSLYTNGTSRRIWGTNFIGTTSNPQGTGLAHIYGPTQEWTTGYVPRRLGRNQAGDDASALGFGAPIWLLNSSKKPVASPEWDTLTFNWSPAKDLRTADQAACCHGFFKFYLDPTKVSLANVIRMKNDWGEAKCGKKIQE